MPTLTTLGSPSFASSACNIVAATSDGFTCPISSGGINASQGWVAARLQPSFSSTATPPNTTPTAFFFGDAAFATRVAIICDSPGRWACYARASARAETATWAANGSITVIGAWTPLAVYFSINGAAFDTGADTAVDTITATTFKIGCHFSTDRQQEGKTLWLATGSGTLSNTDAATIHGYGDTDPADPTVFPGAAQMLWKAADATFLVRSTAGAPTGALLGVGT